MGNSASSSRAHQEDTVDYGYLTPQGVYTGTPDWNQQIVAQLIIDRRLAPFYRPLEEYDENWEDEQILTARRQHPGENVATSDSSVRSDGTGATYSNVSRSNSVHSSLHSGRRPGALKEPSRLPEAMAYRGAVECPICFLYYPPNINRSRCCDQAICTECFVQIKRSEPTTTHLVSDPAACPYCVQENFGVTYTPPVWRAGIGADGSAPINVLNSRGSSQQSVEMNRNRRKSFGADSAEVVTIDHIRPDWEAKLATVRAAVARRANRRIIMRQVGDRLIPVGVTSGRMHPLNGETVIIANGDPGVENSNENEGRSRRSRRRPHQQQPQDINQLLGTVGLGGQDLEELMVMEAMRLSLLEHEERQRKEAEEKKKKEAELLAKGGKPDDNGHREYEAGPSSSSSVPGLPPIPTTSPIDVSESSSRNLRPVHACPSEGRSISCSPMSSGTPRNLREASSSSRQSDASALNALAATSLRISSAHSGSSGHSRSGSATPSFRAPTPRENVSPSSFSTLSAALAAHGTAAAVLSADNGESSETPPANVPNNSASASRQVPNSQDRPAAPIRPQGEEVSMSASVIPAQTRIPGAIRRVSSVFTGADEDGGYDALPSEPDSPCNSPLLTATPVSEMVEQTLDVGGTTTTGPNADAGARLAVPQ
ncbi:SIP5 [Sanghuangporus sanghuang]